MPKITIDGKDIEFEGKHYLLQFALDNDIEIPYFCYHPEMSIPTNCRMCLVEVGQHMKDRETGEWQFDEDGNPVVRWGRKPNTACNTPLSDGMIVRTHRTSETIDTAQKGVLEYMLVNHPLDCPICDQAGECPLQIWTYKYGPEGSRFENQKRHKKKRVDLGPNVILDQERCINCTRCTRFTEEISGSCQLTIVGRGDKNYPDTPPGTTFDDPYSMNTIDICPVGALTSKQHRFQARVWEMAPVPGIDMNDSTGTNISLWLRDNQVMRITPRENQKVNKHWMPDIHRLNVDFYNENRVSGVKIKGGFPLNFEDGLKKAAQLVENREGNVMLLGSAYASLESNYALKKLAEHLGVDRVYYVPHIEEGRGDKWLIQDDCTPNAAACEWLGFVAISPEGFKERLANNDVRFVYALENDRAFAALESKDLQGITVIAHATHHRDIYDDVDVLLPAALSIEGEGTYVNFNGIPQVSTLARQVRQMTPDMWMRLPKSRLDKTAVAVDKWRNLDNIFDVLPSWQLIGRVAGLMGVEMPAKRHQDIFTSIQLEFEALSNLKVSYKPPKASFKHTQLEYAPNW